MASKNDEKMKGNKMAKKSQQEAPTPRDTWGPGPWGVCRGRGLLTTSRGKAGAFQSHPPSPTLMARGPMEFQPGKENDCKPQAMISSLNHPCW